MEHEHSLHRHDHQAEDKDTYLSHSCIHDEILHQRRRPGIKEYSVTPQVYEESDSSPSVHHGGRTLLGLSVPMSVQKDIRQPIRIYLNYDAVGHSPDRDCRSIGDIVKLGEPPTSAVPETLVFNPHGDPPMFGDCWYSCTFEDISGEDRKPRLHKLGEPPTSAVPETPVSNPNGDPPMFGDCWYNCTFEDIAGEDRKQRVHKALGQTADWFGRALAVEPVKGNLQLSGYPPQKY